jgi:signal peptidase I
MVETAQRAGWSDDRSRVFVFCRFLCRQAGHSSRRVTGKTVSDESRVRWVIVQQADAEDVHPERAVRFGVTTPSDEWARSRVEQSMEPMHSSPPPPPPRPSAVSRGVSEFVRTILLAALVFLGARMFVLPYEVEGASMTPNLHDQERVLVNRSVYYHFDLNSWLNKIPGVDVDGQRVIYPFHSPERGDIVVLHPPVENSTQPYIKRVIGLAGETVSFNDGWVYINGNRLDEPYINGPITSCDVNRDCQSGTVPAGYVFVLGDNRDNSADSRSFGFVKIDEIIGKAWFANWPLDRIGILPSYDYKG